MKTGKNNKNTNKNSGFSLVELIVVMAIMAVVISIAGVSVATLSGKRVTKAADEIVTTIERARVLTLGKEQNAVECVISENDDGTYRAVITQGGTVVSDRELGSNSNFQITVYFDGSATGTALSGMNNKELKLQFDRASGAFVRNTNSNGEYCTGIEITGNGRDINIVLVGKTGKVTRK